MKRTLSSNENDSSPLSKRSKGSSLKDDDEGMDIQVATSSSLTSTPVYVSTIHPPLPHMSVQMPTPRLSTTVYDYYTVGDIVGRGKYGVVKRGINKTTREGIQVIYYIDSNYCL